MSIYLQAGSLLTRLRNDRMLRNTAVYLFGSVAVGVLGYAFHFETGRLLGPVGYSVVASAIAGLYLLTLPIFVLQLVTARFTSVLAASGESGRIRNLLIRVSGFSLLAALPVLALLFATAPAVASYLRLSDTRVVLMLGVASLLTILITINRGALQGLRRFYALSGNGLIDMSTRLVLAAALIWLGFGPLGAVAAVLVGPILAYAQSLFLLRRLDGDALGSEKVQGLAGYAVLAGVAGIGINYLFSIDTLLAKHYLSPESAGIYAAASVLARVIYFLGLTVVGVMFPEVASLQARNEAHFHVVDLALLLVGAMGTLLILLYSAVPGLILLPYGAGFAPVRAYLGAFAVALTLLAVANLLISYFLSLAQRRFIPPLLAACAGETLLITLFHSGIWQILGMVLVSLGLLAGAMLLLYAADRWRVHGEAA